ncbi:MAG TPA: phage/plasmid primase, P4 family [Gemmatimonadales bacterium]|nr:phage/plasmid primase, P4 family [Gemmatimonadales bacterium]
MNDLLKAAREFKQRGWEPIPVIGKSPDHLGKDWQKRRYDPDKTPGLYNSTTTGIGLMLGPSGLVDLEADCPAAEVVLSLLAPATGLIWQHARRCHRLYVSDATHKEFDRPIGDQRSGEKPTLVEVRARARISVAPPSLHDDGLPYQWVLNGEPAEVDGDLLHRVARLAAIAGSLAPHWPQVPRQNTALALAGFLRRRGVTEEEALAVITGITAEAEDEEPEKRVQAVRATYAKEEGAQLLGGGALLETLGKPLVDHLAKLLPPPPKAPTFDPAQVFETGEPTLTDTGNATRLAQAHGKRLRYARSHGWLMYDGKRWARDEKHLVIECAKATVRGLYAEAAQEANPFKRKEIAEWAQTSESANRIVAMVKLAESIPAIAITSQELDRDPWLLNCRNGVVDLRTGARINHGPEQLLTLLCPVDYDPAARCPTFLRFLGELLDGRQELVDYFQRWLGYSLTGDTSEQQLLFCHGLGGNGKSTLFDLIRKLLGDYAMTAPPGLLLEQRNEQHPTRIAALMGKRLVISVEVGQGKRLAEELVKQLTGETTQSGRFMRQDFFEFDSRFKLFLAANYKPRIKGTDWAIWRRIPLLPFDVTFYEDKPPFKDKKLPEKLAAELPGVLAWAIQGCMKWQAQWLSAPKPVKDATAAYRAEMDILGVFLADCCTLGEPLFAVAADLYDAYKEWCVGTGERVARAIDFGERLRERGFESDRETVNKKQVRVWRGLSLGSDSGGSTPGGGTPKLDTPDTLDTDSGMKPSCVRGMEAIPESVSSVSRGAAGKSGLGRKAPFSEGQNGPKTFQRPLLGHPGASSFRRPAEKRLSGLASRGAELPAVLESLQTAELIAFDTETTGLNPRSDSLRLLSLATDSGTWVIDAAAVSLEPLFPLLSTKRLVAHNAVFDLGFLHQQGFVPGRVADTMLLSQLLHAGADRKHSLQEVALRELEIALAKELQTSDWGGELSDAQIEYAAKDAALLLQLHESLTGKIDESNLTRVAEIESRCLPAIAWMSAAGVPVDALAWETLIATNETEALAAIETLNAIAPARASGKLWNWNSHPQMLEVFDRVGVHLESTREEELTRINHPLVTALLAYRHAKKATSTYGMKWLARVQEGRVYPSWRQLGSCAGRMSCSDPNMQQLPRDPRFRACIAAPPGRMLVKADYSQIELRIAAKIAGETAMMAAYQRGDDLHVQTARMITGRETVGKEERQLAKAVGFGLLYGMGAARLQGYARSQYGVELTAEEAARYREAFFTAYPALRAWHRGQRQGAEDTRTLAGRRRLGVEKFTEKLNSPVQGTGADGLKQALALLWERRDQVKSAVLVIACHDEIVVECDEIDADTAAAWLVAAMKDGMADLVAPVPVEVEVQTGHTWAG